ncbi:MAG: 3-deoxy-D-manno-octulosonate 8-phosphate phosphatase (KDO 8-P phosphatase) [Candidatus Omnitrophota bacterium]
MNFDIHKKASLIRLLALDLDGVLTDGRIYYGNHGDEIKAFDIQDGLGLVLLKKAGIPSVIISGKKSAVNRRRAKELGIKRVIENCTNKKKSLMEVASRYKLGLEEICYIGDDLIDIPVLKYVGLAIAVQNAVEEVKQIAHYTTQKSGGRGAVREVTDMLIRGRGKWSEVCGVYLDA